MITQLTRFVLATAGALAGLAVVKLIDWTQQLGYQEYFVIILFVLLGAAIGFILGGILGRELTRAYIYLEDYVRRLSGSEIVLATVGLLVGLLVALIASTPFRTLQPVWIAVTGTIVMFIVASYLGVRVALMKRRDFSSMFPRLEAETASPMKVLDTSAIIDGRFAEMLHSGFLEGQVRVPSFVLSELQTLSDSADDVKRARGKRGLDLLTTLQSGERRVESLGADYPSIPDVDSKLVQLAKDTNAAVITVDHNLSQVARVQGVDVLNLNELSSALRPNHLPGEGLRIAVLREGKEAGQGVGYLEDGTMVVITDGRESVGAEVDAVITSVLQTSGGRMLFAKKATS